MNPDLTYFAIFYVLGILVFGLFVRFFLSKKRLLEEKRKLREQHEEKRVFEEMAKKISKDARRHRRDTAED
ncbi:MAG: hypothetical protein QF613_04715 [Candidatus Marinimicrobia bacterium]|jgi:hypothetical protein|nr:hypothetical protein [Candidatus Neomarinimicrobiota bacterium]MDP6593490.1 hypothetical protein [Candidatus Neomarinimicrobiota bacterium]MDP6836905.1 hypothetical protein [Candidatus Neomarinimicrobiota bacterium]MDP6966603.1 hypothetical protein [Candidatus Neomarinimicrobiota bacterium]|tara:strand:+ start:1101 stop:1313 length:213 start_codon:yes stop_codon:yes gene_type:complete